MEESSNSNGKKDSRRAWPDYEERLLMDNLKELVKTNWKTDNGFRPGYQKKLEDMMTRQIPGTDIRAIPHINSKITMWKRNYSSIRTMLDSDKTSSGIGFNTTTGLIDCTDEQWERVVKRDPSAATMRLKMWLMFEDWIEVFGNDRATGKMAENEYEAFSNLEDEDKGRRSSDYPDLSQGSTGAPVQTVYNMETGDFF